ncbi:hypothetical protein ACJIZ3_017164 [Penstemon smallii]|uniref:Uncharacterized protein n=1 Tax=Penstemon smallii TaxID=265156 RepID=A0ABD3SUR8_9LAMI
MSTDINSEALMLLIEAGNEEADYRDVNEKSFIKADLRWKQATNSSHCLDRNRSDINKCLQCWLSPLIIL